MNEQFVYLKLVTGEQLMAYKESEDEESMTLKFPMLIKTHMVGVAGGRVSEQVTAGPYTLFVDTTKPFHVNKKHIVLDTQLSEKAIPHYVHLVRDHEGVKLSYTQNGLDWEDEVKQPDFDPTKAIAALKSIAEQIEEVEDEEDVRIFIEGNNTFH